LSLWSRLFSTSSPETGEPTIASVKTDATGAVTDIIYGMEDDKPGERHHGHIWGLGPNTNDSSIGGRDKK
jgi:hypothetical protein